MAANGLMDLQLLLKWVFTKTIEWDTMICLNMQQEKV